MKRDARLQSLSSDHHHALVLARRARARIVDITEVRRSFDAELAPHFALEEEVLLPALREAGLPALAARTEREHGAIRDAIAAGDLPTIGELVMAHVRFEERELFPACEERLPPAVLDTIGAHRPR